MANGAGSGSWTSLSAATSQRIPGEIVAYAGTAAPSASWLLCYGQAISRTTYSTLFSILSTTYGTGDGSTTFNLPDLRGRVVAGQDDMGGSSANRLTSAHTDSLNGDTLGATGGLETSTLITAELPSHSHNSGTLAGTTNTTGAHTHSIDFSIGATCDAGAERTSISNTDDTTGSSGNHSHTVTINSGATATAGSGTAHNNVQPTIILNYLIFTGL